MHTNEELVRGLLAALTSGDYDTMRQDIADNIVFHFPGRSQFAGDYTGKSEMMAFWARQQERMDGVPGVITVESVQAINEQVIAIISLHAPVQGKELAWHGQYIFHVRDAQIAEWWCILDDQIAFDSFWSYKKRE